MEQGAEKIESLPPNGNMVSSFVLPISGLLPPMLLTNVRLICLGTGQISVRKTKHNR